MTLNEIIKYRRKELKLKQSEAAEIMGISLATLKRWERGETSPKIKDMPALASALGVSVDYLLNGADAAPAESRPADDAEPAGDAAASASDSPMINTAPVKPIPPDLIPALSPEQKYDSHGCPRAQYWASVVDEAQRMSDNPQIYEHRNAAAIQDALYGLSRAQAIIRHIVNTDSRCKHIKDELERDEHSKSHNSHGVIDINSPPAVVEEDK